MTIDEMTGSRAHDHGHLAARLGLAGAILGMFAGLVQVTIGTNIPEWTGAKDEPVALGALTIVLSAIAALAASWLRTPEQLTAQRRAAVVVAFIVPAVLCFTTVGRLWYIPGAMLLAACALAAAAADTRDLLAAVRANWTRGLVSLLGAFVVLMAVSASPILTFAIGVSGGLAVLAAPWLPRRTKPVVVVTMLMAALPFAVITWWSIASPLVAVLAVIIGITAIRHHRDNGDPQRHPCESGESHQSSDTHRHSMNGRVNPKRSPHCLHEQVGVGSDARVGCDPESR